MRKNNFTFMYTFFSNLLAQPWEPKFPDHMPTSSWFATKIHLGNLYLGNLILGRNSNLQSNSSWTIDLTDILTRREDPQEADHKLSTTLHRKPNDSAAILNFHSNHSLKCREGIVFVKALKYNLLMADDTLLQKKFDSLTVSLLDIQYPL